MAFTIAASTFFLCFSYYLSKPNIAQSAEEISPTSFVDSTPNNNNHNNTKINLGKAKTKYITKIQKGDSLFSILKKAGIEQSEIHKISLAAKKTPVASKLKIGNKIVVEYADANSQNAGFRKIKSLSISLDKLSVINFTPIKNSDKFNAKITEIPTKKVLVKYDAVVKTSAIAAMQKSGLPNGVINNIIHDLSHQINFQKQLQRGDKITLIAEKITDGDNNLLRYGKVLHVKINTKKKDLNIYRYSHDGKQNSAQFFTGKGASIKNSLLTAPVKFTRISGHYGWRTKHPILGRGAMHSGIDYAAPKGTPIKASADGVVASMGWKAGYGKFVEIKHNNKLSTFYAHASKYGKIQRGSKVSQGDIIAYVGESGSATGPHLHWEVRVNGKPVNPAKFKSTPGIQLSGKQLAKFNAYKNKIANLGSNLDGEMDLTELDMKKIQLY